MADLESRFWSKVTRSVACWEWQAARNHFGYGTMRVSHPRRMVLAHRVSWELYHLKAVPEGLCVLHRCDNPACVNPHHLFLGTLQDNIADMHAKGRHVSRRAAEFRSRTCCSHGHAYTEENVRMYRGARMCRACVRDWNRKRKAVRRVR